LLFFCKASCESTTVYTMYSVSLCGGGGPSAAGTLQGMAGVISAPRIVFTFANVVLVGVFRWPPCHIVNSTPDAISKRVK
jgi:hypothetical protein